MLPVKADHSGIITGIVHDTSSTGSTLYVEPKAVVELGNKLQTSRNQEKEKKKRY